MGNKIRTIDVCCVIWLHSFQMNDTEMIKKKKSDVISYYYYNKCHKSCINTQHITLTISCQHSTAIYI